eukprot:4651435-Pyramimonas_sp.AAC.1
MCAALRREPHFENNPPSFREVLAAFARRYGESHILKTTRSQSVKLSHILKQMCAALRREPQFENDPP